MAISRRYDYVIIDCGPSLNLLNQNALSYVDEVIIPVTCDYLALVGVKQVLRTIKDVERHLGHAVRISARAADVLRRPHAPRARGARDPAGSLQAQVPRADPLNTRLAEAPSHKQDHLRVRADSHGAADYNRVATGRARTRPERRRYPNRARRPHETAMQAKKRLMAHDPLVTPTRSSSEILRPASEVVEPRQCTRRHGGQAMPRSTKRSRRTTR